MSVSVLGLSERLRANRVSRRAVERTMVTVRRREPPAGERRFSGRVIIDGNMHGDLIGDETRRFDVEPGEHTLTVRFARRPVIFSASSRAKAFASVSLIGGEQADFVCGIRPEVVRLWIDARRVRCLRAMVLVGGWYLAVGLAVGLSWFIGPYVREAVALAVIHLPVNGPLIPLSYRLAGPLLAGFCLAILNGWTLRRWRGLTDTSDEALLSRFGSPYYLERSTGV